MNLYKTLISAILLFATGLSLAQVSQHVPSDNRVDPIYRRKSNLDGNNVRVTVSNYGIWGVAADNATEYAFEWPKNTLREHIYFIELWVGGEVVDESGNTVRIVDVPQFRENPVTGESWTLEPVPGFINPDVKSVARSDEPDSWPTAAQGGWRDKQDDSVDPGWIGSWNGFFGKNIFNADQEMFYRCGDDNYTRYNYISDATDPTRGGLGLLIDVRAFAWTQILINDVTFFIHDIKNDGTKRISKTVFGTWIADLVGGDSQDDEPFIDLQTDIAFITDKDRIGTEQWGSDPVGLGAIKFLETPGNQVDGIDNDGDADSEQNAALLVGIQGSPGVRVPLFTSNDFRPRTIGPGDKIVLIDSLTFERRIIEYPVNGGVVNSLGFLYDLPAEGVTFVEDTLSDLRDDDLDGLIDENLSLHLERFDEVSGTEKPVRYINYLSFDIGDTVKRGFIVSSKAAEMSYENMAPMIDESRDDGFDNDNDWNIVQDDLGLDGAENSGDTGEGDGSPSSGTGTDFPGEPNIDKTDVSETDLIGITGALVDPAFNLDLQSESDARVWRRFMEPGKFFLEDVTGEYDTYVSSGYFPIEPGERQRFALAVAMAGGGISKNADIQSAINKAEQARIAYETDYRFAQAPLQVTVTAVPGDRKVTLYWDDAAEFSEDQFIKRQDGPYRDFEGYRVYRATDAAFLDAKVITDGQGVPLLLKPIAQFDLDDGKKGFHPVDINGVKYYLGDDTGLKHSYTDSNLVNGQRYFYAVTAYDFGYEFGNISPTESPVRIDVDAQGNIITGTNVVVIRPRAPVAGYIPAEVKEFIHTRGSSTGQISFKIVDHNAIYDNHEYELTFEDTLIQGAVIDILTTKNFTLTDLTANQVKIDKSINFNEGDEVKIVDGFQLSFVNVDRIRLDNIKSGWNNPNLFDFQFSPVNFLSVVGEQRPSDYQIIFSDVGTAAAKDTTILFFPLPGKDVNFKVWNISEEIPVEFAFAEIDGSDGKFSIDTTDANRTDTILLLEENDDGKLVYTWQVTLNLQPPDGRNPQAGDTMNVYLQKPFLTKDIYRFTMLADTTSETLAKEELDLIRVVPNPYVAAERWEPRNPFSSGRGPRELHFINLPRQCTIRIFDVNGALVDKLEHNSTFDNGTVIWDMLSMDNLEISYGVYIYHIDAPGVGEKTGTFAIIK
jgi:hypothetical protein